MTEVTLLELIDRRNNPANALPAEVDTRARWVFLDTLGCALAGSRAPTVRAWLRGQHLQTDPYGTSTDSKTRPVPGAAMALAMGACWDEACEGHARAHGRPGVAALSAIWPHLSELNWGQLIRALVVGYEVGARMGALLRIAPGMHVDANWPSLGAAAAAASAMGLDSQRIMTAINIAGCQLPLSLYRPIQTGDTARNTYLGHAAILGNLAAESAAVGITAPDDAIASYSQVAYGKPAHEVFAGVGDFQILSGYFKAYAAVRHVHYSAQAALILREQTPMESIDRIDLWTYDEAVIYCGIRQPQTPLQAQFSLSFGLAAMLRWGYLDPRVYRSPSFEDPMVRALEAKVVIHVDPAWTSRNTRAARLHLGLHDGRTVDCAISAVPGDQSLPWSESELRQKFLTYSKGSLSEVRASALADHVLHAPLGAPIFPECD